MAVIKANAYGHGLVEVARVLESADAFAVARLEEGLALRAAGIRAPVVLLQGVFDAEALQAAAEAGFELVVHTSEQIDLLRVLSAAVRLTVWLKLDTGMNRLGFNSAEFGAAHTALSALPAVRSPVNLFTHLACADTPDSPLTAQQLARFAQATRGLPGARCIANSAALLGVAEARVEWIRPGLVLYGACPIAGVSGTLHGLRAAMTLQSHVIALKDLVVGDKVGYGGDWTALRPTRLAVAAVGYGDGYPRSLGSGTPVVINGERAALAGRVSMDMIAIDVTDLARSTKVGDPIILWGEGLPVEEIAACAGTIPYELLCGISQRVARVPDVSSTITA